MKATGSDSFNLLVNNGVDAVQVIFHVISYAYRHCINCRDLCFNNLSGLVRRFPSKTFKEAQQVYVIECIAWVMTSYLICIWETRALSMKSLLRQKKVPQDKKPRGYSVCWEADKGISFRVVDEVDEIEKDPGRRKTGIIYFTRTKLKLRVFSCKC